MSKIKSVMALTAAILLFLIARSEITYLLVGGRRLELLATDGQLPGTFEPMVLWISALLLAVGCVFATLLIRQKQIYLVILASIFGLAGGFVTVAILCFLSPVNVGADYGSGNFALSLASGLRVLPDWSIFVVISFVVGFSFHLFCKPAERVEACKV